MKHLELKYEPPLLSCYTLNFGIVQGSSNPPGEGDCAPPDTDEGA